MHVQTKTRPAASVAASPEERVQALDWNRITDDLALYGSAVLEGLLSPLECREISSLYPEDARRSEEHTSELQSLMRISYAVFCLKKTKRINTEHNKQSK